MVAPEGLEAQVSRDSATLRRALAQEMPQFPGNVPGHPYLVVLSGLPGTGKSHFANQLAQRVPLVVVGSDRCRKSLVMQPQYTRDEHTRIFAACHRLIEELLTERYGVIFDATNLTDGFRQPLYDIAGRTGAGLAVVWFTAPRSVIRRRLDQRASGLKQDSYSDADWPVYLRLLPGEEAVRGPHLVVDSSVDTSTVLEAVVRRVSNAPEGIV